MSYSIEFILQSKQLFRAMKCECAAGGKVGHEKIRGNWICNNCGDVKKAGK